MTDVKICMPKILADHAKWLAGEEGGKRAILSGALLSGANLFGADLSYANLFGANLSDANLSYADLRGAELFRADLRDATFGDGVVAQRQPLIIDGFNPYRVILLDHHMMIGCALHSLADWAVFDDRRILEMDGRTALAFWRQHKATLLAIAKADGRGVAGAGTQAGE